MRRKLIWRSLFDALKIYWTLYRNIPLSKEDLITLYGFSSLPIYCLDFTAKTRKVTEKETVCNDISSP